MSRAAIDGGTGDRLAGLLPPELVPFFDDRFIRSCSLFEGYVFRLAIRVARATGLDAAAGEPGTAREVSERAGLDADRAPVTVDWLLGMLATQGLAAREGDGRWAVAGALPDLDPGEVADEQKRHDPSCLASYRIAALAAEGYPSVLRGEATGEEILFAPDRMSAWFEYFSNENPIYAISNAIGACAVARALGGDGGAVLELGGGLGSGAAALVQHLAESGGLTTLRSYSFTEFAPSFLRRGQRRLSGRFPDVPFTFGRLDMNRPFREAGVEDRAFAVVYGVNTLHVAHDLEFTLGEIRRALQPGGRLVLSECIRPFPSRPVYVEFIFNLLEAFRAPRLVEPWRPSGGFLTPEQWTAALEAGGFRDVTIQPDIAALRDHYPSFVVATMVAVLP